MKTKLLIVFLFSVILSSCASSPEYLPEVEEIDVDCYGSYITIKKFNNVYVSGELIAVDSSIIIILKSMEDSISKKSVIIPVEEVSSYSLQYAEGINYGAIIPIFALTSLSHGLYAVVTLPLNLIVTLIVTVSGNDAFTYNNAEITIEELKMFARFPQGIPPNIRIGSIR